MKCQILFATLAMLCGALANPIGEVPKTRTTLAAYNNLTSTTYNYCNTKQTASYNSLSAVYMKINTLNPDCFNVYSFFANNYAVAGNQIIAISSYVMCISVPGIPSGVQTISGSLQSTVNTLNAALIYLSAVDSTSANAISPQLQALVTLGNQIIAKMNTCASNTANLYTSCDDTL